jgi:hypothetical protein
MMNALRMPTPADRIARRTTGPVKPAAIRALTHLRPGEQTPAPADRIARRI